MSGTAYVRLLTTRHPGAGQNGCMHPFNVDPDGSEPPFEQIRRQIAQATASGALAAGHKLPTVRQLAAELGVAVNTVARSYKELEADGVVDTQGRKGTFVASGKLSDSAAMAAARDYALTARQHGLSIDEALRLVSDNWG